ncbi:MAG TPA: FAD-dependent monooxygenase, partial [Rhodanobacteraceae bacterium]|nr:FAD-dependent monooxygenase [Rhodanobacteraceae bacterium]
LDATLVKCAVSAGACFLPATRATLEEASRHGRRVTLRQNRQPSRAVARVVLDCGGLASRLLPEVGWRVLPQSRIGVAASWRNAPMSPPSGVIYMACSKHGYAGLVRAERGITNIAAALDPARCREAGGPARAVEEILKAAGLSVPDQLDSMAWRGTPHLSRTRCRVAAERVLILGDAAGYVEPFTGEGMAWALADAAAVFPFVREAVACWSSGLGERWSRRHANMVRARQDVCLKVSKWLRHPSLVAAALPLLDFVPATVAPLMARLNRELKAGDVVAG